MGILGGHVQLKRLQVAPAVGRPPQVPAAEKHCSAQMRHRSSYSMHTTHPFATVLLAALRMSGRPPARLPARPPAQGLPGCPSVSSSPLTRRRRRALRCSLLAISARIAVLSGSASQQPAGRSSCSAAAGTAVEQMQHAYAQSKTGRARGALKPQTRHRPYFQPISATPHRSRHPSALKSSPPLPSLFPFNPQPSGVSLYIILAPSALDCHGRRKNSPPAAGSGRCKVNGHSSARLLGDERLRAVDAAPTAQWWRQRWQQAGGPTPHQALT